MADKPHDPGWDRLIYAQGMAAEIAQLVALNSDLHIEVARLQKANERLKAENKRLTGELASAGEEYALADFLKDEYKDQAAALRDEIADIKGVLKATTEALTALIRSKGNG